MRNPADIQQGAAAGSRRAKAPTAVPGKALPLHAPKAEAASAGRRFGGQMMETKLQGGGARRGAGWKPAFVQPGSHYETFRQGGWTSEGDTFLDTHYTDTIWTGRTLMLSGLCMDTFRVASIRPGISACPPSIQILISSLDPTPPPTASPPLPPAARGVTYIDTYCI